MLTRLGPALRKSYAIAMLALVVLLGLVAAPTRATQQVSAPTNQDIALLTGPSVPPVFGPNVRANSDLTIYGQHEPSLAVSRTNPNVVVAAAKDYRNGNVKRAWIYVSTDGGATWPADRQLQMPGTPADVPIQSDPVVMARDDGRIYVACLAADNTQGARGGIFITWTDDNGATWRNPSVAVFYPENALDDKEWFAIDNNPASPYYHRMYMMYAPSASYIVEQHSTDGGLTWSARQSISATDTEYTYPVVASDGTVYNFMMNAWGAGRTGNVQLTKSTNGGVTWTSPQNITQAQQPSSPIRAGDSFRFFAILSAAVDPTDTDPNTRDLYVAWTDRRNINTNGVDVVYIKSSNGGQTWGAVTRLSHDPTGVVRDHITPMITADATGKLHAFWLDRRLDPNNRFFDSWYSSSTDGGATWDADTRVSTQSQNLNIAFPPGSGNAAGDYWGLDVSGNNVYVAWNDTRSGDQDILVSKGVFGGGGTVTPSPVLPSATRTATRTSTVTAPPTLSPSATVCPPSSYTYVSGTATIVPGTVDVGNHCDDCETTITLPFPLYFYDVSHSSIILRSNGGASFSPSSEPWGVECLPNPNFAAAILPYWRDLRTDSRPNCPTGGCGIFTSITGQSPNRVFNVEWRAVTLSQFEEYVNFEIRLYENDPQQRIDFIYGQTSNTALPRGVGVQRSATEGTQFSCLTSMPQGLLVTFSLSPSACGTATTTTTRTTTAIATSTQAATPSATVCVPGACQFVAGVTDTGNHCDDCTTAFTLPFPFTFYDQTFTTANLSSNGNIQFAGSNPSGDNTCLPAMGFSYAIMPHWDNLRTDTSGSGIYTSLTGAAPNRILNIEWRTTYNIGGGSANFEVRLYEGQSRLQMVYGVVSQSGNGATVGLQRDANTFTQYSCNAGGLYEGYCITSPPVPFCATATRTPGTPLPVPTSTPTSFSTATQTPIATATSTQAPTSTSTTAPTATQTPACGPSWRTMPTPTSGVLSSVAVVAYNDVWVVGPGPGSHLYHWNGSTWQDVPYPLPSGAVSGGLSSVSAWASNDVWAGGSYADIAGNGHPLVEHWNGSEWTIKGQLDQNGSGPIGGTLQAIKAVDAVGPGQAWGVGGGASGGSPPVYMRCTMSGCVTGYVSGLGYAELRSVSGFSIDEAWAVGFEGGSSLVLHYTGGAWNRVSSPDAGPLRDVEAIAPNDVWAAGSSFIHWDGAQWSSVRSVVSAEAISGVASNDVWAVSNFVQHWNGIAGEWLVDFSAPYAILYDVSALSSDEVWSVGGSGQQSYVLRYTDQRYDDVPPGSTFYRHINYLSCLAVMSGYADGTFRPNNPVTRGQLSKIVSNAAGFNDDPGVQVYEDVAPDNTFFPYVQRLTHRSVLGGYPCGGTGTPCVPPGNRPYFLPNAQTTRGQIAKIVANAAGLGGAPTSQTFEDVPPTHTFYPFIERLANLGVMGGYPCGSESEPCNPPANRAYFRPDANATRGQTSKIVANTFFAGCCEGR